MAVRGQLGANSGLPNWSSALTCAAGQSGLALYWRFVPDTVDGSAGTDLVRDMSLTAAHPGFVPLAAPVGATEEASNSGPGPRIVPGTPTRHEHYPCGAVHKNIWHFAAPEAFLRSMSAAYGGRLTYTLMASSGSGKRRHDRGSVVVSAAHRTLQPHPAFHCTPVCTQITGRSGRKISHPASLFPEPQGTRAVTYTVLLREGAGWVQEPTGEPVSRFGMRQVLQNVTDVLIRGDMWTYSGAGSGQEVVYLLRVGLYGGG